jgi:hypothetical protein
MCSEICWVTLREAAPRLRKASTQPTVEYHLLKRDLDPRLLQEVGDLKSNFCFDKLNSFLTLCF